MNETGEGEALSTLSAAVELAVDQEQPFLCSFPGCSQRFSNPNRLDAHRARHNMALTFGKDPVATLTGENTPTPTRFLRGDDSLGLFSELQDPNPFDESFRHINVEKNIPDALSVVDDSSDVLTTPVIPVTGRASLRSDVGPWFRPRKTTLLQAASVIPSVSASASSLRHLNGSSLATAMSSVSTTGVPSIANETASNVPADSLAEGSALSAETGLKMGSFVFIPGNVIMVASDSGSGLTASLQQPRVSPSTEDNSVKTKLRTALVTRNPDAQVEISHKLPLPPYDPVTITQNMESSSSEDGDKLSKLRERNKAAAARCRQKKKKFMSEMEMKCFAAEQQTAMMQQQMAQLRSEVAHLKSMLLQHKDCPVTQQQNMQQAMVQSDTDGDDLAVIAVVDLHAAHAQHHVDDDDVSYQ